MLEAFATGFHSITMWQNILAMLVGLTGGVIAGAIPGLSATMAVALLLPLTYGLDPLFALALIAGIHNGAAYGGSIPAILLRIPGTPAAVATTFDGYPMAQQGFAGRALRIAVLSSAVGGIVSAVALMTLAPPLANVALAFGPPEIFWVSIFGLVSTAVLIGNDALKGLLAACIGLLLGTVGIDAVTGVERFTFGSIDLASGLPLAVVLIALFGLPAAFQIGERTGLKTAGKRILPVDLGRDSIAAWPWRRIVPAWVRGSFLGVFVGILPGLGGAVSSITAYGSQKRSAGNPEAYGTGDPAGLAVAECANNADNAASLIPALTLAIPGSGVAAVVLAGLLIHGLEPGPQLFSQHPDVVYGYMWAMLFTSAMLVVVGGPLATRFFSQVLYLPSTVLMPVVVCLTVVGTYTFENSMFHVYLLLALGVVGYALDRLEFPVPPIILALFLGPKVEFNLRISLRLSQDDWSIFWTRPISIGLILATVLVILLPLLRSFVFPRTARARENIG